MGGGKGTLNDYILSPTALRKVEGSSKGTQPKYFEDNYWYKADSKGYEGLAEYLVSKVLEASNIVDYVKYERCSLTISSEGKGEQRRGCRSEHFLGEKESFVSFERLHQIYTGTGMQDMVREISEVEARIEYALNFIKTYTGVDCRDYLAQTLMLDAFTLNIDRHFNNLGIIVNEETDKYRIAPIFDNGAALLSNFDLFPVDKTLEENITKVVGQPFSSNLWMQAKIAADLADNPLFIDYIKLQQLLNGETESRGSSVLRHQSEKYKDSLIMNTSEKNYSCNCCKKRC